MDLISVPPVAPASPATSTVVASDTRTKVFVAMPWYKDVHPACAFSVMGLCDRARTAMGLVFDDAYVVHSRNRLGDLFLQTGLEWCLTLDSDMVFPFGNADWFRAYAGVRWPDKFAGINTLDRLLSHHKTLIGGMYVGRHKKGKPLYAEGFANAQERVFARKAPQDIIKPTAWVATGSMLIHRSVFLDIEKTFPHLARSDGKCGGHWFSPSEAALVKAVDQARAVLAQPTAENAYKALQILETASALTRNTSALGQGEDVCFCRRAKQAGHQPYVDFGMVAAHIGTKMYLPENTEE